MKKIIFIFLLLSMQTHAGELLTCEFGIAGTSMGTIGLEFANGNPTEKAIVNMFFAGTKELPVTVEELQAGEYLNVWLAKGDSSNNMQMVVKPLDSNNHMMAKLINPTVPTYIRELQGSCTF